MTRRISFLLIMALATTAFAAQCRPKLKLFKASNAAIQYFGRVDFSNPLKPRFWSPGVYIRLKFKGPSCSLLINDEMSGDNHNYIEIAVDDNPPLRVRLNERVNVITAVQGLNAGPHVLTICKDTESGIGYLDFVGVKCAGLLPLPEKPKRKIEYIGDSITTGTGFDIANVPCDKGKWYDQHNAYMSYGPLTSRALNAQWQLTAVAGIGLTHSCCDMDIVMPDVLDKVYLRNNKIPWDFRRYQPDVVTICLGQNDGIADSVKFCGAYVNFIGRVRKAYPRADIICLTSPMANDELSSVLKRYLSGITTYVNDEGDKKVYRYFFSKRYHNGCGGHPDMQEHVQIAAELTAYIKQVENW